jgi:isoquinoline 1-oxidoreductase beta subunit
MKVVVVSGGGGEMSYAVANHRVEWVRSARGVDVGAWRGAGDTKLWAAVDPGTAVQPKNIVARMRSAMTFGLGAALKEQIAIKGGVMQASNFDGYPVLRMSEVPPMDVAVVSTEDPPTGIGEAGVPAVAPAIANAVAQLTGKRLRHLPMTPQRVKHSLG